MVDSLVRQSPLTSAITVLVTVLTALLWILTRQTSERSRLVNLVRTNICVSYVGLLASALTHGYTASPAAWFVALVPLFAAYHLPPRDTVICAGVSAFLVVLVGFLEPLHPVDTELLYQGWELTIPQLLNVALVLAFATNASRTHAQQLEIISKQSAVVAAARDAALEAAETKSRFLANMSHEIRTPLNGMLGLATMLEQSRLDDEQRHWVTVIRGSGRLLVAILNDILDYSKLESDSMLLERIEFDLENVVMDVVELFYTDAGHKGVELAAIIDSGLANRHYGDPLRLGQVLLNLVSNGVKFTEKGSVVIRLRPGTNGVHFEVGDTGVGIDPEKLARLFRPFHQVDSSITRQYGGTGLGLAISQRLATMMGGPIRADSVPGQGSRFCFDLPLEAALDEASAAERLPIRAVGFSPLELESFQGICRRLGLELDDQAEVVFLHLDEPTETLPPGKVVLVTRPAQHALRGWAQGLPFAGTLLQPLRSERVAQALRRLRSGEPPAPAAPPAMRPLAGLQVLVTEDNAVNRKVMSTMLEAAGATIRLAATGVEAVQMVCEQAFDVVLMDLQMPVMDGIEATRLIRSQACHQPQIVAVTADVLPEARAAVMAAGADGFLTKPLERETLLAELENLRARQAHADQHAGHDAHRAE
jgi:two-component system, sensor histidine kinase and response regulator